MLPSGTPSYDANGNLTSDGFFSYTWDAEGKVVTVNGATTTYDGLGRRVERYQAGAYLQIVRDPLGFQRAY